MMSRAAVIGPYSTVIAVFIFLAGCSTAPAPPVPSDPVDPDAALAQDYADIVLAATPEKELKVLCYVVGKAGRKVARETFIRGYSDEITDDHIPPVSAWRAYSEKLYMICIERGWWS